MTTHGTPIEAEGAIKRFQTYGNPILVVSGNMDSPEIDGALARIGCSINGRGVVFGNIGIFGVSAAPLSPLHTPYEISEDEIFRSAESGWNDVKSARWRVLVSHAPPHKTKLDQIFLGRHVGSTAIRTFIDMYQPDGVICGHIHEARGTDTLGVTRMINCGSVAKGYYAVVEIGETITMENCG